MARATAQWEALTARGLEHHTRTSDKRGFCGPTQGIRGAGAAEVLRGLHPCFGKPPSSSPGAFWLRSCAHMVTPPITPAPPPRPPAASHASHEARLERMGMMQPWCREIAG